VLIWMGNLKLNFFYILFVWVLVVGGGGGGGGVQFNFQPPGFVLMEKPLSLSCVDTPPCILPAQWQ